MANLGGIDKGFSLSVVEGTGEKMVRMMLESGYGVSLKSLILQESNRGRGFKVHQSYAVEFMNQPRVLSP
ncbi:MAG: hypothetical protein CMO12_04485 [Thaumarchaeota archaeon]|jgi:hypothetical protein|nr:hypothetical protein [Nitrososphaerota archaeon]